MVDCAELNKKCRQCERLFRRDERYLECPDCGEPRACGQQAITGSLYCKEHGGPMLEHGTSGKSRGNRIKTGKGSKSMLLRLASKYMEQTTDSFYMLNKKSIDLVDARVFDLLERTDSEASPERVRRITELWRKLNEAVPGLKYDVSNDKEAYKAYIALDEEMEAAYHDYQAWRQIFEALEIRRKLTESEVKILEKMTALMTAEDGMELVAQLFAAIMKVLRDEPKGQTYLHLIRIEFEKITGATNIGETQTGRGEVIDL